MPSALAVFRLIVSSNRECANRHGDRGQGEHRVEGVAPVHSITLSAGIGSDREVVGPAASIPFGASRLPSK